MGNKWILDVLADLKAFAEANQMPRLADQIELTSIVAAAEIIAGSDVELPGGIHGDGFGPGRDIGALAGRRSA